MAERPELGEAYCDTATGFEGVAVGRWEKLGGVVVVQLSVLSKEGRPMETWFEEGRLAPISNKPRLMGFRGEPL